MTVDHHTTPHHATLEIDEDADADTYTRKDDTYALQHRNCYY